MENVIRRVTGFYWVRDPHDGWIVCRWDEQHRRWEHAGYAGHTYDDNYFMEIDERTLKR